MKPFKFLELDFDTTSCKINHVGMFVDVNKEKTNRHNWVEALAGETTRHTIDYIKIDTVWEITKSTERRRFYDSYVWNLQAYSKD